MQNSTVVDNVTGKSKSDPVRTSTGTFLRQAQTSVVAAIEKKVAQVTMVPVGECFIKLHMFIVWLLTFSRNIFWGTANVRLEMFQLIHPDPFNCVRAFTSNCRTGGSSKRFLCISNILHSCFFLAFSIGKWPAFLLILFSVSVYP